MEIEVKTILTGNQIEVHPENENQEIKQVEIIWSLQILNKSGCLYFRTPTIKGGKVEIETNYLVKDGDGYNTPMFSSHSKTESMDLLSFERYINFESLPFDANLIIENIELNFNNFTANINFNSAL